MKRMNPVRHGMNLSIAQGITYGIHTTATNALYLTGLITLFGGGHVEYGLLTAIPLLANAVQIVSAHVGRHAPARRHPAVFSLLLAGLLWLGVCAAVFFASPSHILTAFFIMYGAIQCLLAIHVNLWSAWMGDLVPLRMRGRYFGRRNMIVAIPMLAMLFATGLGLDAFAGRGMEREGLTILLAFGAGMAVVSAAILSRQYEPPVARRPNDLSMVRHLFQPLHDRNFLRFMIFTAIFSFFNGITAPLWNPVMLNVLDMPYSLVTAWTLLSGVVGLVVMPWWGKASDRFGNKPILLMTLGVAMIHPLLYIVARPDFLWPVLVDLISSSVMWGGFSLALFNLLLSLAPPDEKEMFIALHITINGIGMGIGALCGGVLADVIPPIPLLGMTFSSYDVLFATTTFFRFVSLMILATVAEKKARPVADMLGVAFYEAKQRLFSAVTILVRRRSRT